MPCRCCARCVGLVRQCCGVVPVGGWCVVRWRGTPVLWMWCLWVGVMWCVGLVPVCGLVFVFSVCGACSGLCGVSRVAAVSLWALSPSPWSLARALLANTSSNNGQTETPPFGKAALCTRQEDT